MAAVDSSSMTLADYASLSNSPLVQKITMSLIKFGSVLQDVPLISYNSLIANGSRFTNDNLPTIGYRNINEEPTVAKAVPTPYSESAFILSNNIDVDKKILQDRNAIGSPFGQQLRAYLESVTYDFNDKWINNNHISGNSKAPIGIRWRLDNPTDFGIPTALKINAGGVDISAGSNGLALLEYIDQMLQEMGAADGDGVTLYMSETCKRKVDRAVRSAGTSGGFNVAQDQFNREVMRYKLAVVRVIGRKKDGTTSIITNTETTAGVDGASTYTSIYGARFATDGGGVFGWQFAPLENSISQPYDLPSGVQQRVNIDWAVGIMQEHNRAFGRVYGIKVS